MPIRDGTKTVAALGTPEALADVRTPADWVAVQALSTNSDIVNVGASTVTASRGVKLSNPGDAFLFPPIGDGPAYNLADIFVKVAVNGEGVSFLYGVK